jgi:hypothetical protein
LSICLQTLRSVSILAPSYSQAFATVPKSLKAFITII